MSNATTTIPVRRVRRYQPRMPKPQPPAGTNVRPDTMNHAASAILLYRVGTCIEVLAKWCPPVKSLLAQYVANINHLADWHQAKAIQPR